MVDKKENGFMPADYEAPKPESKYLKFTKDKTPFRILDSPIVGWVQWENKNPIRTIMEDGIPEAIDPTKPPKHFWAMPVWEYEAKFDKKTQKFVGAVKILEITQKSIQKWILAQTAEEDWGSPTNYDIVVNKTGKDLETRYSCVAKLPKKISEEIATAWIATPVNLEALFTGEDPFKV